MKGVIWAVRRFALMPLSRKITYLEALFTLCRYRILVFLTPNRTLSRTFVESEGLEQDAATDLTYAKSLIVPFEQINRAMGGNLACVPSAMAVRSYLLKHGIKTDLKFGARIKSEPLEIFEAHCWLEANGQTVWGQSEEGEPYATFQRD